MAETDAELDDVSADPGMWRKRGVFVVSALTVIKLST